MFNTKRAFVGQNKNIFFLAQNRLCDMISYPISNNNKNFYNYFWIRGKKHHIIPQILFCLQCIGS